VSDRPPMTTFRMKLVSCAMEWRRARNAIISDAAAPDLKDKFTALAEAEDALSKAVLAYEQSE
jgi:hypothetical protein